MVSWIKVQWLFTYLANNWDCHERPFINLILYAIKTKFVQCTKNAHFDTCFKGPIGERKERIIFSQRPDLKLADIIEVHSHY